MQDALLAEAGGPGGCASIDKVDTLGAPAFFPQLRIATGRCQTEHGDSAVAIAGFDETGVTYLLDSPSAFRFLLRRHAPLGVNRSSLVEYARLGLIFSGWLRSDARLVRHPSELSDAELASAGRDRDSTLASTVEEQPHGLRMAWVTTVAAGRISTFGVTVDERTGEITVLQRPGD